MRTRVVSDETSEFELRSQDSDVPLTMRVSLVGDADQEMNETAFISDWQRGFDLGSGKFVTNGGSLRSSEFSGGC